jgi:hypothetical protein
VLIPILAKNFHGGNALVLVSWFLREKFYNIVSEQLGESGYGFEFHHKPIDS